VIADGSEFRSVSFEVVPRLPSPSSNDCCWILFHSVPHEVDSSDIAPDRTEIEGLRFALAAAIDDRELMAEDAQAAAEESQSSDEELRSTNEELETAKEELQSTNEELSTLNEELRLRNTALTVLSDDMENVLAAVEIPILFTGVDLVIRRFNRSAGKLFDLGDESVGRPLRDARSTMDVTQLVKLIGAVIGTNTPADVEVQDASGDWRLLRIRAYRKYDGRIDGAIVAILDINDLKRSVLAAESTTRAANLLAACSSLLSGSLNYEYTLETLARLATEGFADWCAVDLLMDDGSMRNLTISHVNPVLCELAIRFQKTIFENSDGFFGPAQALRDRSSILLNDISEWKLTGIGQEANITQLIDALGVRSIISVPLIVRGRILGTTTFVTAQRKYGEADLQLAESLAQRAAAAVDTAFLFREAESANRYKDEFLGTVAHELRTPLTSMIGWIQLAKLNHDLREEAIRRVDEGADLLRTFVEDLLDVSRIREQKLSMNMEETDLAAVVQTAIEMTSLNAEAREIEVDLHVTLDPAVFFGDRVRLLQVVWNLLSNAIKFTPPGGKIDVRLVRDRGDARLSVMDTGNGVSPDFVSHAFELYRQAKDVSESTRGLGIGLSIVAHIVKAHGGTVSLESPGISLGTTVTVVFPLTNRNPDIVAGEAEATV